ncbi:MFS transporter [Ruicaihuangia caeni]|uniref:MFS transporter n=1 Tax=Ruicaihuangia caeni TaxID=3042517 RepID=UPI00338F9C97
MVAVLQRSSLGVAGVEATERYSAAAAALSMLAVVQLIVYAALQIPVGVLIDRFGPKRLLLAGGVLMIAGQLVLAVSETLPLAVGGRLLVGAGDASAFISVTRLLVSWFSPRRVSQATQWLGSLGAAGQVLSAFPLAIVLREAGWTPAFLSAAAMSVIAIVLVLIVIKDAPEGLPVDTGSIGVPTGNIKRLVQALGRPGTQLGFWTHFTTQSPGNVLTLLWGFPLFSVGFGFGPTLASTLLVLMVAATVVSGPVLGALSGRYPMRRSTLVFGVIALMVLAQSVMLYWPWGSPPFWVVMVAVMVLAAAGPASLIGFDFARMFNPTRSLGSANGVVNVGGFIATFTTMFLVGLVLDLLDRLSGGSGIPSELYAHERFRLAFAVQYLVVGTGVVFMLITRRRTRAELRRQGIDVTPLPVVLRERWRRRRS